MTLDELSSSNRAAVTMADVAELLGKDPRTISRAVRAGELPSITLGRSVLIPRLPLLALLIGTATKTPANGALTPAGVASPAR